MMRDGGGGKCCGRDADDGDDDAGVRDADLFLGQELHEAKAKAKDAEEWCRKAGWKARVHAAQPSSDTGTRGGTCIATQPWRGLGELGGQDSRTGIFHERLQFGV